MFRKIPGETIRVYWIRERASVIPGEFLTSVIELGGIIGAAVSGFLVKGIGASCHIEHINHKVVLIGVLIAAVVYALAKMLEIYARITSSEKVLTKVLKVLFNWLLC